MEQKYCTLCNGPLVYLGALGYLEWYRCQHCGMDQNSELGE